MDAMASLQLANAAKAEQHGWRRKIQAAPSYMEAKQLVAKHLTAKRPPKGLENQNLLKAMVAIPRVGRNRAEAFLVEARIPARLWTEKVSAMPVGHRYRRQLADVLIKDRS